MTPEGCNALDFSAYGARERKLAMDLIELWNEDRFTPHASRHFDTNCGPIVGFNPSSGTVFLIDEDYNAVVEHDGRLMSHLQCGHCGSEGVEVEFDARDGCDGCRELADGLKEAED